MKRTLVMALRVVLLVIVYFVCFSVLAGILLPGPEQAASAAEQATLFQSLLILCVLIVSLSPTSFLGLVGPVGSLAQLSRSFFLAFARSCHRLRPQSSSELCLPECCHAWCSSDSHSLWCSRRSPSSSSASDVLTAMKLAYRYSYRRPNGSRV